MKDSFFHVLPFGGDDANPGCFAKYPEQNELPKGVLSVWLMLSVAPTWRCPEAENYGSLGVSK